MSKKRRMFTAKFKACVALADLSGEHTLFDLVSKYGVHTNQISTWKRQAKEGVVVSFSGKVEKSQQMDEARIKDLHAKIGQFLIEKDSLQQAFAKI